MIDKVSAMRIEAAYRIIVEAYQLALGEDDLAEQERITQHAQSLLNLGSTLGWRLDTHTLVTGYTDESAGNGGCNHERTRS